MNWRGIMELAIGLPLGIVGFYLAVRLASYAVCKSIKQVFQTKEKQYEKEKEKERTQNGLAQK